LLYPVELRGLVNTTKGTTTRLSPQAIHLLIDSFLKVTRLHTETHRPMNLAHLLSAVVVMMVGLFPRITPLVADGESELMHLTSTTP
jgi:hypothetical protein